MRERVASQLRKLLQFEVVYCDLLLFLLLLNGAFNDLVQSGLKHIMVEFSNRALLYRREVLVVSASAGLEGLIRPRRRSDLLSQLIVVTFFADSH